MSDILASPGRQQIKSTASSPLAGTKTLVSTSVGTGGILKLNKCAGASTRGRRVHFDALALLLDAAYGGDMSLVVASAAQMPDVSRSNDEGITALHNAVCAGHFDIVENGADVNACDSDGWTPLHCAASCNNLPMVRFLVDNGACVFATTFGDNMTAADKCVPDEDNTCLLYLLRTQQQMGCATLNSSRVYAAYDFDAQEQDEISMKMGEPITVVDRERDGEKVWWFSTSAATGGTGFVPRNYLCLYPRRVLLSPPMSTVNVYGADQHSPIVEAMSTDLDSMHSNELSSGPEQVDHRHGRRRQQTYT